MSFFINNEFKSKYELHTPKQLISDAGIKLLQFELDDVTGGFTVTNNRCSTIVINSNWDKNGYTLSGMDRDSMPDFFIQKRGHLLSPRYTINSPQKS